MSLVGKLVGIVWMCVAWCCQSAQAVGLGQVEQRTQALPFTSANKRVKVAVIGDSAKGAGFVRVLELIKQEQVDLVLHLGDLAYDERDRRAPDAWHRKINRVLGEGFPYFFTIGNHDVSFWERYQSIFRQRLAYLPPDTCRSQGGAGDLGIKTECVYKGIYFILSGVGVKGTGHEAYLQQRLQANQQQPWKICAWHKNQRAMQAGSKADEVGWKAYQLCQEAGAMIVTGHEHSYARTRTLTDIGNTKVQHGVQGQPSHVRLGPGKTVVACSGLGGASLRPWDCQLHDNDGWWASVFTSNYTLVNGTVIGKKDCDDNDGTYSQESTEFGALFIEFNYNGLATQARGRFVTTARRVLDDFIIVRD